MENISKTNIISLGPSSANVKPSLFTDSSGKKLGELNFDINRVFKDAGTKDKVRERLISALLYLEKEYPEYPDLKKTCQKLCSIMREKKESVSSIIEIKDELKKTLSDLSPIVLAKNRPKDFDYGNPDYIKATKKYDLIKGIESLLNPILMHNAESANKNVLKLSESGKNKYPEIHSLFASTIQEFSGRGISELIAKEIKKGYSIENALLNIEKIYRGDPLTPQILTHRLSDSTTKDKKLNFEVLFINGHRYEDEKEDKFTKNEKILTEATNSAYKNHCKKINSVTTPDVKELENKLKEISDRLKKEGTKKLYIFYSGHGDKDGTQEGVSAKNAQKQGAEKFIFVLNKDYDLSEEVIKQLYNKYLKDIEVITIFDSCHGGAGITKSDNNQLDIVV